MITLVKAFKHDNSSKVEVRSINCSSVQKGCAVGGINNINEGGDVWNYMYVSVYETKSRYYYQTFSVDHEQAGMPKRPYSAFSSSKDCSPMVVAREILDCKGDLTLYE